jgi:hypothetical protein
VTPRIDRCRYATGAGADDFQSGRLPAARSHLRRAVNDIRIERQLMQVDVKGSEGNLNFPDMLNEQIYAFAGDLEDADTAPTKQEVETYAGFHAQLEKQLDAWGAIKRTSLPSFQERVQRAGIGSGAATMAGSRS